MLLVEVAVAPLLSVCVKVEAPPDDRVCAPATRTSVPEAASAEAAVATVGLVVVAVLEALWDNVSVVPENSASWAVVTPPVIAAMVGAVSVPAAVL